jgi:hypothetical protein
MVARQIAVFQWIRRGLLTFLYAIHTKIFYKNIYIKYKIILKKYLEPVFCIFYYFSKFFEKIIKSFFESRRGWPVQLSARYRRVNSRVAVVVSVRKRAVLCSITFFYFGFILYIKKYFKIQRSSWRRRAR